MTTRNNKTSKSSNAGGRRTANGGKDGKTPREPGPAMFPVVGLGASAGGLQPLEEFFACMPDDSGMAFAIVTHMRRGQTSLLPELVGRRTAMPVIEVSEPTEIRPNRIYVSPPGYYLSLVDGFLHSREPDDGRPHFPIDHFFRLLARARKEQAIGIVLSGTGSDGTLGLKEIKANMGLVMAQQEASAAHAGMPHSAIATGLVDHVLPVSEMPDGLFTYAREMRQVLRSSTSSRDEETPEDSLRQVLALLRVRTSHDFSEYKISTIRRRIERRIGIHHLGTIDDYVRYLQSNPAELDLLFKELLIGVTGFFRDPDAFEALAGALSDLLAARPDHYVFRAWVAGCSTGEEAYSIAMLLRELMDRLQRHIDVQIFATDLDPEAIELARSGMYPLGIAGDLSPERLERFFTRDGECYRIKKEIREMLVFAPQSLIEDPPFTRIDLLSCRNLLIYLESSVQKRLFPIFHYALRPGGILFLGTSESMGGFGDLFASIDKKWKLFRRKEVAEGSYVAEFRAGVPGRSATILPHGDVRGDRLHVLQRDIDRVLLRELIPPTVVASERGDIVHIHGRTGLFLEPAPGPQPMANLFTMAREGLQLDLAAAIRQAADQNGNVVRRVVRVKTNRDVVEVELGVRRVTRPESLRNLFLISFDKVASAAERGQDADEASAAERGQDADEAVPASRLSALEEELRYARESHQSTVEQLETANEELKSTNEELQSTNEELQSANEELETSKEEMQSLNEELQMVNAELQSKLEELYRTSDDMKNLLNSTDIATIFLDSHLNIQRFTDQARQIIRLIPADVGRPISDLVAKIRYERLVDDAREVLRTLIPKEVEVRDDGSNWYVMRILPYRTNENVIDGLVITFVDMTSFKLVQESERLLMQALASSPTTVFGLDRELRYTWVCNAAFGYTATELEGRTDKELFEADEAERLNQFERQVLESGVGQRQQIALSIKGRPRRFDLHLEPMRDEGGTIIGVTGVATDIT